jgi:hypothetical protein
MMSKSLTRGTSDTSRALSPMRSEAESSLAGRSRKIDATQSPPHAASERLYKKRTALLT